MYPFRNCLYYRFVGVKTGRNGGIYYARSNSSAAASKKPADEKVPPKTVTDGDIDLSEIDPVSGTPFRKLELIPATKTDESFVSLTARPYDRVIPPPREKEMPTDQDWPSVWPTAHSFKASAVPLPIRMGYQKKMKKPPPSKVANLELMKIPNFLHLTPPAIKRHCEAIKKFCTPWPEELTEDEKGETLRREHFPIEIHTCDYVHAGPSIRDARSRIVTLIVKLDDLPLGDPESRARQKFIKLVGERYNKNTGMVTIVTDRCPVRHQNRDYAMYLLAVLFHESWKEETWEKDITVQDQHKWFWEGSKSEQATVDIVKRLKKAYEAENSKKPSDASEVLESQKKLRNLYPSYLKELKEECKPDEIIQLEPIKQYAQSWNQYRNNPECVENITAYGESVRQLFGLPQSLD